jgi:ribosomal protein S18 acetylase RimI-like enzyme
MILNIRKAIESDIISMTFIYNDSIKLFPSNVRIESDYSLFKELFETNNVIIVEKKDVTKTIGWIAYKIHQKYSFIVGLYLLIDEQRKGIGTKLLNHCINDLVKENCKLIILYVLKNAPWSIEFYKKNGFKIYDNKTHEYGKDYDIIKEKTINDWELLMYKWL